MRVALVGPLPPPSGGMANQTLQLAALLRGEGLVVELVQVNAPYRPAWVARIKGVRALLRLIPYLIALWRAAGRNDVMHVMANSGWSWHLFAAPAIWLGRMRGTPVVVNYRGGEADAFMARSAAWVRPSLARASAVIVPSGYLHAVFAKYGVAVSIVPNVVNLERFAPSSTTVAGPPCMLVARNLEPIYDNATAIRAFAQVRAQHAQARLVIAGSGPLRANLEVLAAGLGLAGAVTFTGAVDNQRMAALYRAATVMLNSSTVDNTPNSVLEAMACGVPVVSTNVGGVPYLVEDGKTGLLVPPGQPDAMARAVLRLLAEPALAASLRAAGLAQARAYGWPLVRPRLLAIYREQLARSSAARRRPRPG